MTNNPWSNLSGKTVKVKAPLFPWPKDSDPWFFEKIWTVNVKKHANGYILIEKEGYMCEVPAGDVVEILN